MLLEHWYLVGKWMIASLVDNMLLPTMHQYRRKYTMVKRPQYADRFGWYMGIRTRC